MKRDRGCLALMNGIKVYNLSVAWPSSGSITSYAQSILRYPGAFTAQLLFIPVAPELATQLVPMASSNISCLLFSARHCYSRYFLNASNVSFRVAHGVRRSNRLPLRRILRKLRGMRPLRGCLSLAVLKGCECRCQHEALEIRNCIRSRLVNGGEGG
jgi:hypothetical protein